MPRACNLDSVSVTSRVKVRELATALKVIEGQGIRPRTRSEIISLCVQAVARMIPEGEWPSLNEAIYELDGRFPVQTRKGVHLITSQSTEARCNLILRSEEEWRTQMGRAINGQPTGGQVNLGGGTVPPPEMRQKDGVMYIIHATSEGLREDEEKYKAQIAAGAVKVVSREEWAEIDRAPTLGLDTLMGNDIL